jgi:hypothetical protein
VRGHVRCGEEEPKPDLLALAQGAHALVLWAFAEESQQPWARHGPLGGACSVVATVVDGSGTWARRSTGAPAPAPQVTRSSPRPALMRAFLDQQQYSKESIA